MADGDFSEIMGVETAPPVVIPAGSTKPPEKKPVAMSLREDGGFKLATLEEQMAFAQRLLTEKMVSESFQNASQVLIGIQYSKSLKIDPILGLKNLYVVNGRPCLFAEGPLGICLRSGLVSSISEFFIDENGERICADAKNLKAKVFGSVTRTKRGDDPEVQEDFFTLDDLARAKIDIGKYGKKDMWAKWERIMLRYKGRTINLRSKFADQLMGIGISEYDENFSPEIPDIVIERNGVAAAINAEYHGEEPKSPKSVGA